MLDKPRFMGKRQNKRTVTAYHNYRSYLETVGYFNTKVLPPKSGANKGVKFRNKQEDATLKKLSFRV